MKPVTKEDESGRALFDQLRTQSGRVDPRALDQLWQLLEPVRVERILGRWKGGDFDTGHPITRRLIESGWYGKTFTSELDAQPLICRAEDGRLYSDLKSGNGAASLWMVEFRGQATATMVYDGAPIFDHFKQVDENTLLGVMNGKSVLHQGEHYWFYLDRILEEEP